MQKIDDIRRLALGEINAAQSADELEKVRIKYLGAKGVVKDLMGQLGALSKEEKPAFGAGVNQLKNDLTAAVDARKDEVGTVIKSTKPKEDITLPGHRPATGALHPVTIVRNEMVEVMRTLGFEVVDGPEVEDEFHNFNALNIPPHHPARAASDNFYLTDDLLLRSQTSTVQIRVMEKRKPPLRVIAPGRVYRPDTVDATHHYMFHQIEGLAVDKNLTMADLKTTLTLFFSGLFGQDVQVKLRPSFFPFTEPSAEIDVTCVLCGARGCSTCKGKGWIEMGGCGMVDPNVFRAVGYDPEVYTGFAFGLGIERLAMRRFGIPDIRLLTENDVRFLKQFA
jgi:phenylalanyl-tRNA synthetase alpha chain